MKKLIAWNKIYGCEPFEVYIGFCEKLEDKKKYYESMGYYCWVEKSR